MRWSSTARCPPRKPNDWKEGIFGLIKLWGLEPDEVLFGQRDQSK